MSELVRRVGEELRRLRKARGLSVRQVAALSNSYGPIISRLESGRHNPSLHTLETVAGVLGVSLYTIVALAETGGLRCCGSAPRLLTTRFARRRSA